MNYYLLLTRSEAVGVRAALQGPRRGGVQLGVLTWGTGVTLCGRVLCRLARSGGQGLGPCRPFWFLTQSLDTSLIFNRIVL